MNASNTERAVLDLSKGSGKKKKNSNHLVKSSEHLFMVPNSTTNKGYYSINVK